MSVHVEVVGQGQPLVLIHGWGMHSGVWQPLVKRLSKDFMLYLVDIPGMGNSRAIEPYHLYHLAEEIAEIIPGVCDILGWSFGGLIAQSIALSQPDRVRRLILVGSTPCFVNKTGWDIGINASHFRDFAERVNDNYKHTILQFLTLQCMKAADSRATIKQLRTAFETKPMPTQASLQHALHVLLETDLRNEITKINRPVLLVHGDRDTLAPVQAAHWMKQNLPMAYMRVMSGAAHAPFLSHTDQFLEALTQFLEPST